MSTWEWVEKFGKAIDFLRQRKKAYQLSFGSAAGQLVLQDLAKFCRATQSCYDNDPRLHAALEGRRDVWLRITQHLHLTSDELYALYGGHTVPRLMQETKDE